MRVVILTIVCLTQSIAFAQTPISEKEFIDIVNLKAPDRVEKMDERLFQVTGYCYFEKHNGKQQLMIRPLGKPANIIVEATPPCCYGINLEQEVMRRIKSQGSKIVKVTIQGIAKSRLQEGRISVDYEPPSVFSVDDKFVFEGDLGEKELLENRLADARAKGMTETVLVTRLWKFYDAKLVMSLQLARRRRLLD